MRSKKEWVPGHQGSELVLRAVIGLSLFALSMAVLSFTARGQKIAINEQQNRAPISESSKKVDHPNNTAAEEDKKKSKADTETYIDAGDSSSAQAQKSEPKWHYGGFVDVGYLLDFN